jgi:hypothetical protein
MNARRSELCSGSQTQSSSAAQVVCQLLLSRLFSSLNSAAVRFRSASGPLSSIALSSSSS